MPSNEIAYSQRYYQLHRNKLVEYSRQYRANHRGQVRQHTVGVHYKYLNRLSGFEKRYLERLRVLLHYSNPLGEPICNNCGEQDIGVLCLDHISGGGSKHVRGLTCTLYHWIVKNSFPEGFQVLCANCNLRKARLESLTSQSLSGADHFG